VTSSVFSQNLIVNGSAENAPITNDWTTVSGSWAQRSSNPAPQDGTAYFFAGAGAFAELYQDIDLTTYASGIDAGTQYFSFSCFLRSFDQTPVDESQAILEYRDALNTVLETYDTGLSGNRTEWVSFTDVRLAPVGSRSVRITLISDRNSGTNNDGYIDNVKFEVGQTLSTQQINIIEDKIVLFPNPSKGNVSFSKSIDLVSVYNIQGKLIYSVKNISKNQQLNIEAKSGLYFIEVESNNKKTVLKHIIL